MHAGHLWMILGIRLECARILHESLILTILNYETVVEREKGKI